MNQANPTSDAQLRALREEFDLSFAQAPRAQAGSLQKMLSIRLGDGKYAIRIAEIGGLFVDRRIMALPTPVPELLGVAGFRGQIAPVYDLAALLGYTRLTSPRWLVLVRLRELAAFAFDTFESHFAAPPDHILREHKAAAAVPMTARPHLGEAVRTAHTLLPIINLQSILESIRRQGDLSIKKGVINHE